MAVHASLTDRLDAVRRSSGLPDDAIRAVEKLVREGEDEQLFRTNPYRLAQATGLSEEIAFELLLHASHAGVFELTWGVLCPVCSAMLTSPAGLRSMQAHGECRLCGLPFVAAADDAIEVAFRVSPSIRRLRYDAPETLGLNDALPLIFSPSIAFQPAMKERVAVLLMSSANLPGAGETTLLGALEDGEPYDVVVAAHHMVARVRARRGAGASEVLIEVQDGGLVPASVELEPGPVTIRLRNKTGTPTLVALRRDPRPPPELIAQLIASGAPLPPPVITRSPYLTGKRILTSQTFRELFRAESLPTESGLQFKSLTLLFTDLKGSTEMYDRIGDFRAFALVREHFELLRGIVAAHGGAIVKTIGDAIMASFAEAAPALAAAAEMNDRIGKVGAAGDLLLKIGLHTGPALAVDSNERLDYFGQTVNIAARVQGLAEAAEIVVTESTLRLPGMQEAIAHAKLHGRPEQAHLKGVAATTPVVRFAVGA